MTQLVKNACRKLRKEQTEAEQIFWDAVRNRKLNGFKFLRQHPVKFNHEGKERFFIADFYCAKRKLVIEIDGGVHDERQNYDRLRDYIINTKGLTVLRFTNQEIAENLNHVLESISKHL